MAGHSKWANIKHRKDRADKKKGKVFSRIIKELISAVKQAGADPKANAKLRTVIQKAKEANIPNDTIERNIQKASSQDMADFEEIVYELYGYGGVGILAQALTDNKNRTASEMRIAVNKCGGSLASVGSVSFNFSQVGIIVVAISSIEEEELFFLVSDAGAQDLEKEQEHYLITTKVQDLQKVKEALQEKKIPIASADLVRMPKVFVQCKKEDQEANQKLLEWLENIDDVDEVFHNMEL